jgi:cyclophilin family peptidyl-prolyl cis-trans isomerase
MPVLHYLCECGLSVRRITYICDSMEEMGLLRFFDMRFNDGFRNEKHCVFGKVIDGLLVLRKIENVPVGANHRPKISVSITNCGQL